MIGVGVAKVSGYNPPPLAIQYVLSVPTDVHLRAVKLQYERNDADDYHD